MMSLNVISFPFIFFSIPNRQLQHHQSGNQAREVEKKNEFKFYLGVH
jgi:hypothetical protein